MSLGFAASALVLYLAQPLLKFQETISVVLLWSVVAGVIWATSFVLFVISIDALGLSRSNQWKNLQGPVAAILGILILGEFATTNPIFAILAAFSIFISAVFFTTSSGDKKSLDTRGVYLATLAGVGFGSVAVIQKYVTSHVGVYSQQIVWSSSIVISLLTYIFFKRKIREIIQSPERETILGLTAGVLYMGASIFQLFSYQHLAVSISLLSFK